MGSGLAHVAFPAVDEESVFGYRAPDQVPGTSCCSYVLDFLGRACHRGLMAVAECCRTGKDLQAGVERQQCHTRTVGKSVFEHVCGGHTEMRQGERK